MADSKVTALDELTSVASTDVLYVVDDPGGSAASKKATVLNAVQAGLRTGQTTRSINYILGGSAVAISAGIIKGDVHLDFGGTIEAWSLWADLAGTIQVDIWKSNGTANYPPTNANSICAGSEPAIAGGTTYAQVSNLAGWGTVAFAADDVLRFNVDGCGTITACTLALKVAV